MRGAEYVTAEALEAVWREAGEAFAAEVSSWKDPSPNGCTAREERGVGHRGPRGVPPGREQARPRTPLRLPRDVHGAPVGEGRGEHRPLGTPSKKAGAARDREQLLALLLPVQRAAEKSALVRALVEAGDVYHPLAWTAKEAYAFLKELPLLESAFPCACPLVTCAPRGRRSSSGSAGRAWEAFGRRRARLHREPAIDGARTPSGARSSRPPKGSSSSAADGSKPTALASGRSSGYWQHVERAAKRDGIPFHEALRLVAGASLEQDAVSALLDASREWSRVEAGPWMKGVLDGLRASDAADAADGGTRRLRAGERTRATTSRRSLRPYQRDGVRWLGWAQYLGLGVCLADEKGVSARRCRCSRSRSFVALAGLRRPRCSSSRRRLAQLTSEAARFAPSLRIRVAHGASAGEALEETDAVTTYGTVTRSAWLREREETSPAPGRGAGHQEPGASADARREGG